MSDDTMKHIPPEFLSSMAKECNIDTSAFSNPLEAIRARVKAQAAPVETDAQAPQVPLTTINGFILPIDAMTMLMVALVELSKTNKDVDAVLKAFDFRFPDVNGKMLYPRETNGRKKTRSTKRGVR